METIAGPKVAEGAPSKARRYLTEGRLTVHWMTYGAVHARCQGDGVTYELGLSRHRDWCECPAKTPNCAHLRALRLVVDRPG